MSRLVKREPELTAPTVLTILGVGTAWMAQAGAQAIEFGKPVFFPDTNVFSLLTSADFDRDGRSDVVVGVREGAHIYFSDGEGGLSLGDRKSVV